MGGINRDITRVRPPGLRRGDTVGIVAPASAIQADALMAGMTVVVPGQFQSELCLVEAG